MKLTDNWFTALSETEQGGMVFINGREGIDAFRLSGKFKERVEISWKYQPDAKGMPAEEVAKLMEAAQEVLQRAMEKDKLAIMTGVYTGEGERLWVFYTRHIPAFGEMLNSALASFEQLPISIYTEKDPEWEEYMDMYELKSNQLE